MNPYILQLLLFSTINCPPDQTKFRVQVIFNFDFAMNME